MKNISVCLVGDSKTGKTSFINYLLDNKFNNFSETTIGVTSYNLSFKKQIGYEDTALKLQNILHCYQGLELKKILLCKILSYAPLV